MCTCHVVNSVVIESAYSGAQDPATTFLLYVWFRPNVFNINSIIALVKI